MGIDLSGKILDTLISIAAKLDALLVSSNAARWNVTAVQTSAYNAQIGDAVQLDTTAGPIEVFLPTITPANKGARIMTTATPMSNLGGWTYRLPIGQTVVGYPDSAGPGVSAPQFSAVLVSDGISNWLAESKA